MHHQPYFWGGGGGGGGGGVCRNQWSPVKVMVLERHPVASVLEVVWNTLSHSWQRKKLGELLLRKESHSYKKQVLVGSYIQL